MKKSELMWLKPTVLLWKLEFEISAGKEIDTLEIWVNLCGRKGETLTNYLSRNH